MSAPPPFPPDPQPTQPGGYLPVPESLFASPLAGTARANERRWQAVTSFVLGFAAGLWVTVIVLNVAATGIDGYSGFGGLGRSPAWFIATYFAVPLLVALLGVVFGGFGLRSHTHKGIAAIGLVVSSSALGLFCLLLLAVLLAFAVPA